MSPLCKPCVVNVLFFATESDDTYDIIDGPNPTVNIIATAL